MQTTKNYIEALKRIDFSQASETSLRTAFENYINEFIEEAKLSAFKVLQEGKRIGSFGVPDFRISFNDSMLGYIETKKTDENLDKILKTEQIKKYRELSPNLLITNYIEFVWIKDEMIQRETLCYLSDIENKKIKLDNEKAEKVEKLLLNFFSQAPEKISLPKDLALALAVRCKNLKDFINDELNRQNEQNVEEGRLFQLYKAFKDNIFSELSISEFSDAFAQMLVYGFFLAGLNADTKKITIRDTKYYIPASFQLIKELLNFLDELEQPEYLETKWIIDETISIINNIEWVDLKQNLSFNRKKLSESSELSESYSDPYIYFYETFLATYDYNLRKSKGVYYTPPQVVNFIVRAIDDILIQIFNLSNGLADRNKVTVLDFATGTGTFLLEVFKIILENIPKESPEKRKMIIQDHILKNLFGFEYLIAPYTIAHLKLSQFLKENGYEFQDKDRLQVYLTNTLEPVDKQIKIPFMPQLSKETKAAQEIKDKPILVITGNPPYSGISKNNGTWISKQIDKYKFIDGAPLNERKIWLNDDYVKFIRFAQDKMDKAEHGIVGIITNHSFLDNPTFRGMRQSLMNTFDQMYFIDLHGNAKKKEKTPEGEKDENVFDIEQGVCISILIKKQGLKKNIFHTDFWGLRSEKYDLCLQNSLLTIDFVNLIPKSPYYFFVPKNNIFSEQYSNFYSVRDIFFHSNIGICSQRDRIAFQFSKEDLLKILNDFKNKSVENIKKDYELRKDGRDWKVAYAKENIEKTGIDDQFIKQINYRLFDKRWTFFTDKSKGFIAYPRYKTFKNLFIENNFALVLSRQIATNEFKHIFVSDLPFDQCFNSNLTKEGNYAFPLYLVKSDNVLQHSTENIENDFKNIEKKYLQYEKIFRNVQKLYNNLKTKTDTDEQIFEEQQAAFEEIKTEFENAKNIYNDRNSVNNEMNNSKFIVNFTHNFKKFIKEKYEKEFTPEQILGYIYAILHSQTYRTKYAEFLKSDFPRIPFTSDLTGFQNLSGLGYDLIERHLMKKTFAFKELAELGEYKGEGDNVVIKLEFKTVKIENETKQRLYINKTQYFETVPEDVYNFYIGGYQVLDKYLKDRKGRSVAKELFHITEIIKTLYFTIEQMKKIDNETLEWI